MCRLVFIVLQTIEKIETKRSFLLSKFSMLNYLFFVPSSIYRLANDRKN
nr:MAG TPA: hypothetical protein [Caudoviricetes sp.]